MPRCPSCQAEPPAGSRFCNSCGAPLEQSCPDCGNAVPPGSRFCNACGAAIEAPAGASRAARERDPGAYTPKHLKEKILRSRSALEGERKQVTVLFADVQRSMELQETMDPEEWHAIMDRFLQVLTDGVHRFEGKVNQYTGDGIMALFGAPIAHEDHAQRACYAALQLRDDLAVHAREVKRERGLDFATRIGLHSGEVVVGKIGDDLRMDYTAQGHTVGLAARLEALAAPNTVYLSDATAGLVAGYFELQDLGEFPVRGASEPVRVHQLESVGEMHTRFDVSRARGLSRFVGRDADMQALDAALEQALAGNGQVVGVVADPGTGKSRLCYEFVQRCRARDVRVLEGYCVAHGKNIPLLPILQAFRTYFGIHERDDDRTARDKLAGRLLLMGEEYRDVLPVLFEFFGVPDPENPAPYMDPDQRQRQLFGVLRRLGARTGPRTPTLTLIEDLHWIDGASEAWLAEWVEATAGAPTLLLTTFRPEYHADWMQNAWYRQLPLAPLGPDAIRELLDDLLGSDPSIGGLAAAIHERTGGNPFFTEEVVQSLIEAGNLEGTQGAYRLVSPVETLAIPARVESLLAARIDRLPEREKHVLQAAAVIGFEFSEPILEAVAELPTRELGEALGALKSAGFVHEVSLYPVAEYCFKHRLTTDVALHSQLGERRRRLHAAVARALEEAHADKLDAQAALLAYHSEEAGDARAALGWHARAAKWVGASDAAEAVRHWQRVRSLGPELGDDDELAGLRLAACEGILNIGGWRLGLGEEEVGGILTEGRELADRLGDEGAVAILLAGEAVRRGTTGNPRGALALGREAATRVDACSDPEDRGNVQWQLAYWTWSVGDLEAALAEFEKTEEMSRGDPRFGLGSVGHSLLCTSGTLYANALAYLGRLEESAKCAARPISIAREAGLRENLGWALTLPIGAAWLAGESGAGAELLRDASEAAELADALGSHYSHAVTRMALAQAHELAGSYEAAAASAREAVETTRQYETCVEVVSQFLAVLSSAELRSGDATRARATAGEAVSVAESQGARHLGAMAHVALARALLADAGADECDAIERALARGFELARASGARVFLPQLVELRAELAGLQGDAAARERDLREALRLYTEMGASGHAARLGELVG